MGRRYLWYNMIKKPEGVRLTGPPFLLPTSSNQTRDEKCELKVANRFLHVFIVEDIKIYFRSLFRIIWTPSDLQHKIFAHSKITELQQELL